MTNDEVKRRIQKAQDRFYAWTPGEDHGQSFKCWHIEPFPRMSEAQCQARAKQPELYRNAGCSNACPRWRHYRKLVKQNQRPVRIPYL